MANRDLFRLSGIALLLDGLFQAITSFLSPEQFGTLLPLMLRNPWSRSTVYVELSSWFVLTVFGLVGLHIRQAEKVGRLGLIGFMVALLSSASLTGGRGTVEAYALGFILLGITTMRAGVLPRLAGLLLIVGTVLTLVPSIGLFLSPSEGLFVVNSIGRVIFGIAFVWLGYALWSEKDERAT